MSGMIACAYLIKRDQCPLERAFLAIKRCIPFSPNVVALARLGDYEKSLFGNRYISSSPSTSAPLSTTPSTTSPTTTPPASSNLSEKERRQLTDELKYVRRKQKERQEDEEEQKAVEKTGELNEEARDLC